MTSLLSKYNAVHRPSAAALQAVNGPPAPRLMSWEDLQLGTGGMGNVVKFTNCRIFHNGKLRVEDLWIRDGRVIDPASRFWEAVSFSEFACDAIVDCGGLVIAPGFIDVQFNGGWGVDFSDPDVTEEDILRVCTKLLATGVTSICPTLVSSSPEVYRRVLAVFRRVASTRDRVNKVAVRASAGTGTNSVLGGGGPAGCVPASSPAPDALCVHGIPAGARILGLHLEGPFIHPKMKGAHALHNLVVPATGMPLEEPGSEEGSPDGAKAVPDTEVQANAASTSSGVFPPEVCTDSVVPALRGMEKIYGPLDWGSGEVRMVTVAPELPGALATITALASCGVVVSIGHTTASIRVADEALVAGASMVTHLFNAMSAFHHRDPGVVGLLGRSEVGAAQRSIERLRLLPSDGGPRGTAVSAGAAHVNESTAEHGSGQENCLGMSPARGAMGGHDREIEAAGSKGRTSEGAMALGGAGKASVELSPVSGAAARLSSLEHVTPYTPVPAVPLPQNSVQKRGRERECGNLHQSGAASRPGGRPVGFSPELGGGMGPFLAAGPLSGPWLSQADAHAMRGEGPYSPLAGAQGGSSCMSLSTPRAGRGLVDATGLDGSSGMDTFSLGANVAVPIGQGSLAIYIPRTVDGGSSTPSAPEHAAYALAYRGVPGEGGGIAFEHDYGYSSASALPPRLQGRPFYGLIADGVHVHPYAVNIAHVTHSEGLILVTDAMQALGLPVGRHTLGEMTVDIHLGAQDGHYEGLHAVLAGTSTLAGAVVPLDECLRNFMHFTGYGLAEALPCVTSHPASLLRLDGMLGNVALGCWADLVLLDNDGRVRQTWLGGRLAWTDSAKACRQPHM